MVNDLEAHLKGNSLNWMVEKTSIQIFYLPYRSNFDHFKLLQKKIKNFKKASLILLYTGPNMRWKLNFFKHSSLNQASVLVRTHCPRLFTRDHDVMFVR